MFFISASPTAHAVGFTLTPTSSALFLRLLSVALRLFTFAFSLLPRLLREDALVYAPRVADDDELEVAYVCVGDALHVRRRDGAQAFEEGGGVAPAAAD